MSVKQTKNGQKSKSKKKMTKNTDNNHHVSDELIDDIESFRKTIGIPICDDTLDDLESDFDKMNDTDNLDEKIKLHTKLLSYTKKLEDTVDSMVEIIDSINIDNVRKEIKKNILDDIDISDATTNLDKMMHDMKEEEVIQIKILYMRKIINTIAQCKEICGENKFTISRCN